MQRYFINTSQIENNIIHILGEDVHHIKDVMRMNIGTDIYVSDEVSSFICTIDMISSNEITCLIKEELHEDKELKNNITIAHGLVRKEKMETVIDNITELGATSYLPVVMEYSVVKFTKDDYLKKIERLNKIAKEASEQSHRVKRLRVEELISFKELIKVSKNYDLCVVAYEKTDTSYKLEDLLKGKTNLNVLVLVGPEGGISLNEVKVLEENNFKFVSLGARILRTEVAPSYILSAIDTIEGMN